MLNKIKEKVKNIKVGFIYFWIKRFIKKDNIKLFLKWIELKEGMITEYDFNMWVTKNILDPEEEDET